MSYLTVSKATMLGYLGAVSNPKLLFPAILANWLCRLFQAVSGAIHVFVNNLQA